MNSKDKYAKCPFYLTRGEAISIRGEVIKCEGYYPGTYFYLFFDRKEEEQYHRMTFCNSLEGCERCSVHKLLLTKYDE